MVRRGMRIGAACAVVVLLGACTDGGDEPDATTTTVDPRQVVEGGIVRIGVEGPVVVDPATANPGSPSELMVLDLLHDGLTRVADDGSVIPAMAREWRHDESLKVWTFELDAEATFASGDAVTNADVVASIERVVRGGRSSLAALRLERVAGFDEFVAGRAPRLAGVAAAEDGTVRITLSTPLAVLPAILAGPEFGIVDVASLREATGDEGDLAALDLSGSWEPAAGDEDAPEGALALQRRAGRAGHLDGVAILPYDDLEAAYAAFEDGEVDWALIPPAEYEDAVEAHGDDHVAPFHAELFFGLRVTSPDLARAELRTAIAQAIDREAIVADVYAGRAAALTTIVPEGVPGHDPDRCDAGACRYDPDAAAETVEAAFPDGKVPSIAIDFDASPIQRAVAEAVAEDLDEVGIPTELRPKPLDEYKTFITTGAQELFSFGWIGGYASPDAYLAPLFGSAVDDNLTGFGRGDVDVALAAARGTDDAEGAADHWVNVERRVLSDAVVVPIAQFRTQPVVAERVRELAHAVDGSVDWSTVWVADGGG